MNDRLLELGNHVVEHAENHGADQVEAYLESSRIIEVKIEKGVIRLAAEKFDTGCGIRIAVGKQLGVSYVTSHHEPDVEQATRDAIKAAKASVHDSDFNSFASMDTLYPKIKGLYDKEIAQLTSEQAIDVI